MNLSLYTDGGSRGNPGPGGAGVVLQNEKGEVLKEVSKFLGKCTNNEAEYQALILGLKAALEKRPTKLSCFLDSELIVKQLNGIYRVKNPRMRVLYEEVRDLEKGLGEVSYKHVTRDKNAQADALVNEALDKV